MDVSDLWRKGKKAANKKSYVLESNLTLLFGREGWMDDLTGLAHAGSELTGRGSGTTQKREAGARLAPPAVQFKGHAIVQERSCGRFSNDTNWRGH